MEVVDETTIKFTTAEPDSTYLGAHLSPFSWITSPEAITEFGNRWRDEQTNVELSSGTGAYIPLDYDPDLGINLDVNPNYWKNGADGGPLPYLDRIEFTNLLDATAVDAAYRGKGIDIGGFPLSSLQVEGILQDFPEHNSFDVPFGFTIQIRYNFNPDWPGEDGEGNPWADRRLAYAFHVATDRYILIDAVYLGSAKISAIAQAPWFNQAWTVPPDELATWPGYRPNRDEDLQMANELLDAAGIDRDSKTFYWITPDVWEQTYPGITETVRSMYQQALGVSLSMDIQPYTVILQRLLEGTHPGQTPAWTNPPQDLDPTGEWNITHVTGGSANFSQYNYPPAEEMIKGMRGELDVDKRKETASELLRIFLGVHPDHGVEGMTGQPSVMNAISPQVEWPYVHNSEDVARHDASGLPSIIPISPHPSLLPGEKAGVRAHSHNNPPTTLPAVIPAPLRRSCSPPSFLRRQESRTKSAHQRQQAQAVPQPTLRDPTSVTPTTPAVIPAQARTTNHLCPSTTTPASRPA